MVRLHLECWMHVWAPARIHDMAKLVKVQVLATECVPGMRHLSYPEWLDHTKLFSLRRRRLCRDLSEAFKKLRGFGADDPREFSSLRESKELRGHPLNIAKPKVRSTVHQNCFPISVVNPRNRQSSEVDMAPTIDWFKFLLDKAWGERFPGLV